MKAIIIAVTLLLCIGAGFFFFGKQGVYYLARELRQKNEEIAQKSRLIDSLRREINLLTNDTSYIERVAREKLGMARPDERVYKFSGKGK
jgi:cell division protein FtsL